LTNLGGTASQGTVDVYPNEMAWNVGNVPDNGTASVSLETQLASTNSAGSEDPSRVCILGTVASVGKLLCVTLVDRPTPVPTLIPTTAVLLPTATPDLLAETYVVQAGDTLTRIARRYGLTINELVRLNGLADASTIYVGQVLRLRDTSTPTLTVQSTSLPVSTRVSETGDNGGEATPSPTMTLPTSQSVIPQSNEAEPGAPDLPLSSPAAPSMVTILGRAAAAILILVGVVMLAAMGVFLIRILRERNEDEPL